MTNQAEYVPPQVKIDWEKIKPKRFSEYVEQFSRQYKRPKDTEVFVLGFSFGATIAFLSAHKTKPKALILCSLSPYFKEDLKHFKPKWLKWWRDNFIDSDYSSDEIASNISSQVYIIVGSLEQKECRIRARGVKNKLSRAILKTSKGAEHNIGQKEYLKTLRSVVDLL